MAHFRSECLHHAKNNCVVTKGPSFSSVALPSVFAYKTLYNQLFAYKMSLYSVVVQGHSAKRGPCLDGALAHGGPKTQRVSWASPRGGDAGDMSPTGSKFRGGCPPEIAIFKENFMHICQSFQIFQCFQNKVAEIRREIRIWG